MFGGISICLRKRDPSACMMIHILLVHMLQLQSRSILICLVNVTLKVHLTYIAVRSTAALYHTAVGLVKI